jgi:hypothetical protein
MDLSPITDILELLTPTDWTNLVTHAITIGAILGTIVFLDSFRINIHRKNELTNWIRRARAEKESKEHKVLSIATNSGPPELLTAKETRDLILAKKLDPKENVARLAQQCRRTYSHHMRGVNAIAEELYDEVRKSLWVLVPLAVDVTLVCLN